MSDVSSGARGQPAVVAFGGGHGLAASLAALRRITPNVTAVVTVADDGGSSGRLRRDLGVLPPGDLRMALAALCEDDEWGRTWSQVVQHRFAGPGDLAGHSVGNLLIVALWELAADDPVNGLDWVGRLLKASGRVLPMTTVPLEIEASVEQSDGSLATVHGQVAVATASGRIVDVALLPAEPPACPEAVDRDRGGRLGGAGTRVLVHQRDPAPARARAGRGDRTHVGPAHGGAQPRAPAG